MELLMLLLLSISGCQAVPLQGEAADCDDPDVFQAVDLALQAHNRDQKHGNLFALSVVLEANRTAGPGKNFFVKYQLRETACAVDRSVSWQNCEFLETSEGDTGECEAEIHFDDTINFSNIEQRCKIIPAPGKVTQSYSGCLGCWHNMDTKSAALMPIVKYTIGQFNNQSNKQSLFDVGEITKAQRQVVAGWNYKFEYSVKETNCSKDKFSDLSLECKLIPAGGEGTCTVEAYVDIRNTLVRAEQKCKLAVVEHSICAGCPTPIPTDSEILKEPLDAALEKYNSESNNDFYYKVVSVTKATSQVVAGIMYRIEFNIKKTDCSKADFHKLNDDCIAIEESIPLTCTASVYMRTWKHEVAAKVTCEPPNRREVLLGFSNMTTSAISAISRFSSKLGHRSGFSGVSGISSTCTKHLFKILLRRPPGFTPFRSAKMNVKRPSTESKHRTGDELNPALGEFQEDVKEQEDDIATISPNKDFPFDLPSSPDSSQSLLSVFDTVPDLPEPKCPGKPWEPIVTPAVPIDEPSDFDLKDLLPLPGEESTVGPHETVPLVTEQTFGDADLAGGLSFGDFDLEDALS